MAVNSVANAGSYTTFPPSPAALTYVSGTATGWTGATVTLTPTNNATQAAASNPILTTSVAVTRNAEADTLVLTGLPGFGAAYTAWGRGTPQAASSNATNQFLFDAGAGATLGAAGYRATGNASWGENGGGHGGLSAWTQNTSGKIAVAVAANDQAASFNGSSVTTTSNATVTASTLVTLGSVNNGSASFFNGNLEEIAIWFTQRVPNATLQAMTT
jgi:hypothetical protein